MYSELYYKNLLQIKNGIGKIQLCFYLIKQRECETKMNFKWQSVLKNNLNLIKIYCVITDKK